MANLLSKTQAERILAPHRVALRDCIIAGWNQWEALPAKARAAIGSRARACVVYDFIIQAVSHRFEGRRGVQLFRSRGLWMLGIDNRLVVRFKKLRTDLRYSNYPTRQQQLFSRQLDLVGIPAATRLVAGYLLDPLAIRISQTVITLQIGQQ